MWMSDIMYALCFTTVTGTVVTVVWFMMAGILERLGFLNITYHLLKFLLCFWIVPIAYGILCSLNSWGYRWYGCLFEPTPVILRLTQIFLGVWGVGLVLGAGFYMVERIRLKRLLAVLKPCRETWMQELFTDVCGELGISPAKVFLQQSEGEAIPMVVGVAHPKVILPVKEYGKEELRIIFLHELTHVRHKDLLFKHLVLIVASLQAFNPIVWWYVHLVDIWSEYACDESVCRRIGKVKGYYEVLMQMAVKNSRISGVAAGLLERKSKMRRRIEHVKKTFRAKKKSKVLAALVTGCIFLASTGTVCMASVALADGVNAVTRQTEVYIEDEGKELVEYVEPASVEEHVRVVSAEDDAQISLLDNGSVNVSWSISSGTLKKGTSFRAEKGQSVIIGLGISPKDKKIKVGLIQPDGTYRYVISDNAIAHVFEINQSGYYCFFVKNDNNLTVRVEGSYQVY